jgi:hypothetical protein
VIVTNPSGSTATLPGKFRFSNQQLLSKRGLATADFKAQVADSGNCTDRIWLKSIINPILADQIAVPLSKLDPTKKFADYKIGFPQFLQLCSDITGLINTKLENEPCKQRLARPSPDWCTQHQNDTIGAFVDAVVDQILTPAAGAVG